MPHGWHCTSKDRRAQAWQAPRCPSPFMTCLYMAWRRRSPRWWGSQEHNACAVGDCSARMGMRCGWRTRPTAYRTPMPTRVRSTLCLCASVPVLWCAAASRCIAHDGARWRAGVTVVRCCARFSLLAALAVLVGRLLFIPLRLSGVAHAHCCGNGCAAAHCGPLERERGHRGSRPEATGPRPLWWVVEVRARAES
eukprot:scaffold8679_cov121-Isochrysis_galbana.AAC.3